MRPPEEEIRLLVAEWIKKADLDFKAAVRLGAVTGLPRTQ
jgi:hypothetical protein